MSASSKPEKRYLWILYCCAAAFIPLHDAGASCSEPEKLTQQRLFVYRAVKGALQLLINR